MKLIWLQLREVTKNWRMPAREWHAAKAQPRQHRSGGKERLLGISKRGDRYLRTGN